LDVIANILLKNSTFIRSLNMHLYRSNINLKIDIPYSLLLPYRWYLTHDIKYIFDRFNNYHNRLKFTIEYENNHCLSFFDLLIKEEKRKLSLISFTRIPFRIVAYLSSRIIPQNRYNKYSCRSCSLFITSYVL